MKVVAELLKKEDAIEWVKVCLRKAFSTFMQPVVLVLDNAPCHLGLEVALSDQEFSHHKVLRLAPYSPMLNPIEQVWSVMKAQIKKNLLIRQICC